MTGVKGVGMEVEVAAEAAGILFRGNRKDGALLNLAPIGVRASNPRRQAHDTCALAPRRRGPHPEEAGQQRKQETSHFGLTFCFIL